MPTPEHEAYRAYVVRHFRERADDKDECAWLAAHAQQVAILWELDLGEAKEELSRCYADKPRGGDPWDPIVKLRSLHASLLFDTPSINDWSRNWCAANGCGYSSGLSLRPVARAADWHPEWTLTRD